MKRNIVITVMLFCALAAMSQQQIYQGTQVFLTAPGARGTVQWQYSSDGSTWGYINGLTGDSVSYLMQSAGYIRAEVTEGTCNPVYSPFMQFIVYPFTCGDSLIDFRDGKKYPTVPLGTQCWMASHLNYGDMIQGTTAASDNGIPEKYCYGNTTGGCDTYGALYSWNEAMNYSTTPAAQGLCPDGWHIATDDEWIALEVYLGMDPSVAQWANAWRGTDQGAQMKEGGGSGMEIKLGGGMWAGGSFNFAGTMNYTWTSSAYNADFSWRRCFNVTDPTVGRWNTFPKTYGFSVRCLKNQ